MIMPRCHVCGSQEWKSDSVNEVFELDGKCVLVENIPAHVCLRCGEETFSRETTERIRRMVHGAATPVRSVAMEVFSYA